MDSISLAGKTLSLVIVVLIIFFSYITAVNSSSMLSKQLLQAQNMQSELKNQYNNSVTESGNYTSQATILNNQKGKMIPINRDSGDFVNLENLQDAFVKQESKNNPNTNSTTDSILIK
jgi:lipopolysaccharide export LptBFGC system permease protein LptF